MGDERIGQGRDAAKQYLKDNPEICERVEAEIRQNSSSSCPTRPRLPPELQAGLPRRRP